MTIEAPISRHKKTNFKIYIAVCIVVAIIFAYDGYLSKYKWSGRYSFYKEHVVDNDGKPTATMKFNRGSPPFFIGVAVLLGVYLFAIKNKKIVAGKNELIIPSTSLRTGSNKERIAYDSIQKIDKTHFRSKTKRKFVGDQSGNVQETHSAPEGYFIITYKDNSGREVKRKLSSRTYDNLAAVLDELVAKIS